MKKISIGICCYNEEENIEAMYHAITEQMNTLPQYDYEILFEDNASSDSSQEILRTIAKKDPKVKVIFNYTNFGPARSTTNCMSHATGDAYLSLPCDFQEPPEMIPEFIKYWEEGYDVVFGQKIKSQENFLKYFCRELYYSIIDLFSDYPHLRQTTGFGIMNKKVVEIILITKKQDPDVSSRHLVAEYGFNIKLIPYEQRKRRAGKSSYNVSRYFSFALTSLCNTSIKPLRIMTVLGFFMSIISLLVGLSYFIYKLLHWDSFIAGIAPLVIGLFFFSSIQLFCIGMLGEYIGILLRKITEKPLVVEKECLNINEE